MPRISKPLGAIQVKRLDRVGLNPVGGVAGLYLQVTPSGARSWILRATVGRKRRDIGLGSYPAVSLARAREKAADARDLIEQGLDPVIERQKARQALMQEQAKRMTFADAARAKHEAKKDEFRNSKHRADWISSLERHAFAHIGGMEVADITLADVLRVLQPIWLDRTETATRVRQRMESVFTWSIVSGYREAANPAVWKGALKELLPEPKKVKKTENHPALPWGRVPEFMAALAEREGSAARALEFGILTASRSGEIRKATWDQIDLNTKVWTIPAKNMKGGKEHRVPLSPAVVALLKALPASNSNFVFPSPKGNMMSDMGISSLVRRMNKPVPVWVDPKQNDKPIVPHGFRSSFKDWARASAVGFDDEVSELALAHINSDATRAAYARDELLPLRKRMMQQWAEYCAGQGEGVQRAVS
ncbi:phage integrase [Oceanococcus atlanticus]|uniref:Phage integrase n=1 Tax=Oceanococcus atlanticus TaxID=1317117 RepID=A0A1Y1SCH5_9GAMM|nr:site-specific integrase [Oceanococcus atlanticus]ORE86036.1 phage integrase [Oceanococcus atlanticus]